MEKTRRCAYCKGNMEKLPGNRKVREAWQCLCCGSMVMWERAGRKVSLKSSHS